MGNRKREIEERDRLFYSVIKQLEWIIEDVGRPCFEEGLKDADLIVLLDVSTKIRKYRIIKRWLKQRFGIEKCIYKPKCEILKCMFRWTENYDIGKDNLKDRISHYQEKVITLKNDKEIKTFQMNILSNQLSIL